MNDVLITEGANVPEEQSARFKEAARLYDAYLAGSDAESDRDEFVRKAQQDAREDPQTRAFLKLLEDSTRVTAEDLRVTITPCPIDD